MYIYIIYPHSHSPTLKKSFSKAGTAQQAGLHIICISDLVASWSALGAQKSEGKVGETQYSFLGLSGNTLGAQKPNKQKSRPLNSLGCFIGLEALFEWALVWYTVYHRDVLESRLGIHTRVRVVLVEALSTSTDRPVCGPFNRSSYWDPRCWGFVCFISNRSKRMWLHPTLRRTNMEPAHGTYIKDYFPSKRFLRFHVSLAECKHECLLALFFLVSQDVCCGLVGVQLCLLGTMR